MKAKKIQKQIGQLNKFFKVQHTIKREFVTGDGIIDKE